MKGARGWDLWSCGCTYNLIPPPDKLPRGGDLCHWLRHPLPQHTTHRQTTWQKHAAVTPQNTLQSLSSQCLWSSHLLPCLKSQAIKPWSQLQPLSPQGYCHPGDHSQRYKKICSRAPSLWTPTPHTCLLQLTCLCPGGIPQCPGKLPYNYSTHLLWEGTPSDPSCCPTPAGPIDCDCWHWRPLSLEAAGEAPMWERGGSCTRKVQAAHKGGADKFHQDMPLQHFQLFRVLLHHSLARLLQLCTSCLPVPPLQPDPHHSPRFLPHLLTVASHSDGGFPDAPGQEKSCAHLAGKPQPSSELPHIAPSIPPPQWPGPLDHRGKLSIMTVKK